jgi:hypothetical protein
MEIRKQINDLDIDAAQKLIQAGEKEVALASSLPLSLMPQLLAATKIDLAISEKMLEAAQLDKQALLLGDTPEAYQLLKKAAKKRHDVAIQKLNAANQLTEEQALLDILESVKLLGVKKRYRVKRSNHKKKK